jgi:peptidoglycan/LPS O-acetylase OafA/YrhL
MPGLDVVRGIAIVMVMVYHGVASHSAAFVSYGSRSMLRLEDLLRMGAMGVHLFFILSGFLITGILIDSRSEPDYYRNFYFRRALRIVPAYALMIVILKLTHSITWRYVAVCILYFCNMSALLGSTPEYGPLWSLSVEEQFYLTWPFIVRNISRRGLTTLSILVVALTPVLRLILLHGPASFQDIHYKTWALADFLAAGGILAIAVRTPNLRRLLGRAVWPLLISGLILIAALYVVVVPLPLKPSLLKIQMSVALEPWLIFLSGLVIFFYLRPSLAGGLPGKFLVFLAKISYGLYLCHQFIFDLVDNHWPARLCADWGLFPQALIRFGIEAAISIAIAWISRTTFEQYFLRFKPRHHVH